MDYSGLDDKIFDTFAATTKRSYIYICNMETNVSRWSKAGVDYFGLPGEYMYDAKSIWANYVHPDDVEIFLNDISKIYNGEKTYYENEYRVKNKYDQYVMCSCSGTIIRGREGKPDLFACTITTRGLVEGVDSVTTLHNVHEYERALGDIIKNNTVSTILKVGIDRFNNVNLIYGYMYGNEVLRQFGTNLRKIVGNLGRVYRMDGAKFAIHILGENIETAIQLSKEIKEMAEKDIYLNKKNVLLRTFCGAVVVKSFAGSAESINNSVSYALEQSRIENNGEITFFGDKVKRSDKESLDLMGVIHDSVMEGCRNFYLCYQPLADGHTGNVIGMEALVRWKCEPYGEVPPTKFISWLEEDPCFYKLGKWILRQALLDGKRLVDETPNFILNVNITASQFMHKDFREDVKNILEETGFPPQNFCMELTERSKGIEVAKLRKEMSYFRSLGINIALDDFGTGISSMALLIDLPIDEIKIDMLFVREIQSRDANQILIKHIAECAKEMGVKVCIEGVETKELDDYLKQFGATYHQGYFYSKPIKIEEWRTKYS